MSISREEIIHIMDRAMAQENDFQDNICTTNAVVQQVNEVGHVDSTWHITSHRPVLGKLLIISKQILRKLLSAYLGYLVAQINHINALQNRAIQLLSQTVEEMYKQLLEKLNSIGQQQKEQQNEQKLLQDVLNATLQQQKELQESFRAYKECTEQKMADSDTKLLQLTDYCNVLNHQLSQADAMLDCRLNDLSERFFRAETVGYFELPDQLKNMVSYVDFENRYRGTQEMIMERQSVYLPYFQGRDNVLDIGCGRGELLMLLKENQIHAKGIDLDPRMAAVCKEKGLEAECTDAFEYLAALPDAYLDGVFCGQIVEHFSTAQLLRFIAFLKQKVRIGAPVIIETINPGNLNAVGNWFYMDISHVKPVHPKTLAFLMETNGFPLNNTLYLHPDEAHTIPALNIDGSGHFDAKMFHVNEVLFGAQDYALVAYRQ